MGNWYKLAQAQPYGINVSNSNDNRIAEFVYSKLAAAAQQYLQALANKQPVDFYSIFNQVWPPVNKMDWRVPKGQFGPEVDQIRFRFNNGGENGLERLNGKTVGIKINIAELLNCKTPQQVDFVLPHLRGTIYHEATHLTHKANEGKDYDNADIDDPIKKALTYMIDNGEMNAQAKEYAMIYAHFLSNTPFDANKMITQVIHKLPINKQSKANNYFVSFADPVKQQKYALLGFDLASRNKKMIQLVRQYLPMFNQQRQQGIVNGVYVPK